MTEPLLYSNSKKPALSMEQQIEHLRSKNVIIGDEERAKLILKRINYYRLKGYMLPFKTNGQYEKIDFDDLVSLLRVDQLLRSLILRYMEHIEITLRTFIVRALTKSPGSQGLEYLEQTNFYDQKKHKEFLDKLDEDFKNSDELFAIHYRERYEEKPIWVCIDIVSFGSLGKFYGNLNYKIKKDIASYYKNKIHYKRLKTYLIALTYLRNKCAHYNRIYFRNFMSKYSPETKWYTEFNVHHKNDKLFPMFVIMKDMCVDERIWDEVYRELKNIIEKYSNVINLDHIGFPSNWEDILNRKG